MLFIIHFYILTYIICKLQTSIFNLFYNPKKQSFDNYLVFESKHIYSLATICDLSEGFAPINIGDQIWQVLDYYCLTSIIFFIYIKQS